MGWGYREVIAKGCGVSFFKRCGKIYIKVLLDSTALESISQLKDTNSTDITRVVLKLNTTL